MSAKRVDLYTVQQWQNWNIDKAMHSQKGPHIFENGEIYGDYKEYLGQY